MESHEPTFAKQQKCYWRGSLAESVGVLDIGMSELLNANVQNINSEIKSEKESGTARIPSSDSRCYNESLNAESIDGLRPGYQGGNIPAIRGVARLSPPSVAGRGGTILSVSNDTVSESPGHFVFNHINTRDVTRKHSLDKELIQ